MTAKVMSDQNEALCDELDKLVGRNAGLGEEIRLLTARFNSRVRREPQKIDIGLSHPSSFSSKPSINSEHLKGL